ncbi:hypothetical protein IFVP203_C1130385 [Vibrio parahaemolyticus]
MALPNYASKSERMAYAGYLVFCGLVLFFLIAPILTIIPLSFNATPYFTFTEGMYAELGRRRLFCTLVSRNVHQ